MMKYILFLMVLCVPMVVLGEVSPEPPALDLIGKILEWLQGRNTLLASVLVFIIEFIMRRKKTQNPMSLLGMASNMMDKIAPQNCKNKK